MEFSKCFQKIYAATSTSTWYRRYKGFEIGSFFKIFLGHKNLPSYQKFYFFFFYELIVKNTHNDEVLSKNNLN